MATNLILSKSSSNKTLKSYFESVLKLSNSDNEFPINLDEVWMLVYSEKGKAVRALKKDFIEGIDYHLAQNGKVIKTDELQNGITANYYLSTSCLEYFIARKVRPIFEVYRKVFHKTARTAIEQNKPKREPTLTTKVRVSLEWVKGVSDILNLNDSSKLSMLKMVAEPLGLPTPDYTKSKGILKSASELLKANNSKLSCQEFNKIMIDKGFIKVMTRESSKGEKKFKSITGDGLNYGENQVNPNNPKETQPLYYEEKFNKLLKLLAAN